MDFDEVNNYGPAWSGETIKLIANNEPDKAMARAKDAFVQCLRSGDVKGKVIALLLLAKVHLALQEPLDALDVGERALAELLRNPDAFVEGACMHTIAKCNKELCRFTDALELAQEAIRKFREAGSKVGEANVLNTMARINLARGRRHDCVKLAKQARALFRAAEERHGESEALHFLVRGSLALNRKEEALKLAKEMSALHEANDLEKQGVAQLVTVDVLCDMEDYDEATEVATKVVEMFDMTHKSLQAQATRRLADVCFAKGDDSDGWMYAKEALELYRSVGHCKGEAEMLLEITKAHFSSAGGQEGLLIAEEGIKLCREANFRKTLGDLLLATARGRLAMESAGFAQEQHLNYKARQGGKEALTVYQEIGDLKGQLNAHNTLAMGFMAYGNVAEGKARARRAVEIAQMLGDKTAEGANLLLVAQCRFHDNKEEAARLASLASRLLRDGGDRKTMEEAGPVISAIQEDGEEKKDKEKRGAGASLAETMASKMDLTLDFDDMKTRAIYFWGFTSRAARAM
mmetsp:Transcript_62272/g.131642  ORF Transcript_62272/g.131642 Transcript_62272/m.131642 type:complete len:520 (-) Transcript_62272:243-1802(-)|eukprot:CAMPEP_0206465678 /NCGR_PEP_ID=MMETSP0324_2-20121206/27985_1 /ASSEMBLY_ACC=CAM_ASM_000836 /TAXON_ID=2866 /ORGANISM="Crypthecodinium cohnii, Strain Seligo" /LENGTH=519 /DNA_ID=CAMNT_0053938607 /DNA_START=105 /DNA_END=1664 /DNA_ORIENTATION=-